MPQPKRADARRNRDLLLIAATEAVTECGTDASLREIARRAGVGIGTLYRHFPTREVLLEALLEATFETLRTRADNLLDSPAPGSALLGWLEELAAGSVTYQGLADSIMEALTNEESGLHASCTRMNSAGERLLERAQKAGLIHCDLTIQGVMAIVLGLAWAAKRSDDASAQVARTLAAAIGLSVDER
ncbi:TetR/AcrR family transcriptional regulator [Streptomyces sp. NPDC051362]|uniref:TetR/AcrR family transcriptional regulator n=1 Tax=Streptomyces sp. NPDC051362 TaxID=3365651 RepID=UPI003799745B